MSARANPKVIGGFVLGAIVLAVAMVVLMGSVRLFRDTKRYVIHFRQSVNGLKVGAPVKLRGIEVGEVISISFSVGGGTDTTEFRIPVVIQIDYDMVRERGGTGVARTDTMVTRNLIDAGLRASLATESFVTGQLYVSLDFQPGSPAYYSGLERQPYDELPTTDSRLEAVRANITAIVERLSQADVPGLIDSVGRMAGAVTRAANELRVGGLLASADSTLRTVRETMTQVGDVLDRTENRLASNSGQLDSTARTLRRTLDEATSALATVREASGPDAPAVVRAEEAMRELAQAMRALREALEAFERNPSGAIRGTAVREKTP